MMMNTTSNPPWEDLPQELLSTIANFLTSNPIDILTFRAICKSWHSSSPPFSPFNISHLFPIIAWTPSYKFDMCFSRPISGRAMVSVTAIFALRQKRSSNMGAESTLLRLTGQVVPMLVNKIKQIAAHSALIVKQDQDARSWLMFVDQLTPGKLMIRQPLTKYHYSMPINFPSYLDVPNVHVDEIARFYNLNFHPAMNKPPSVWSEHVQKVAVNSDESRAFALFHTGKVGSSKLAMYTNWGASDWDPIDMFGVGNNARIINDIIYHKGKLLGVDHTGSVHVQGFLTFSEKIIVSPITDSGTKRKRLVESNGLIYLVIREESDSGLRFKVFQLDEGLDKWVEVNSVGDMVFFFGLDFSFSVSPKKLGGSFRKNCIVYIEHSFKDYDEEVVDDVVLFSNLSYSDLRVGIWHVEDPYHCGTIGSYPGYSNVLWPPPTWLWPIDMSKRIRDLEVALDNLLINAPIEKLKAMAKEVPSLEQAIVINNDANQQDCSEIWRAAYTIQVYLNDAKDIQKHLENIKLNESFNTHDQAGPSSRGIELQGLVNSDETDDAFILSEMKFDGIILHLEETTTKLQNILKSRQQSSINVVDE